ncbi:RNA 3'-terminal phosphate cyclase [Halobellus litoreus]|uniref:RNA 3'-terminal phosphate cyclase n=2 Tax=Halobellus litoreus TaxID=755310 RepID=A0ABD6DRZ9_9EURY|nr:RNA 3'-terminal phosphate cyclase [Halobellus litoreus]
MLELDGTDGGGQLVRTALTLSALGGRSFRMENVRGDRPNPGLKRQHLACVDLLAALVDADVSGAEVGSETLEFDPGDGVDDASPESVDGTSPDPTDLAVDVGTAGSVTLVADTLLPLAVRVDTPVRATLVGGTDVKWSPPADYLRHVKLPLLDACGLDATVDVMRHGFYPAGGGELAVEIRPSTLSPIELSGESVDVPQSTVYAVASEALEDADVADRIAETAVEELKEREIDRDAAATAAYVESTSPGAVVTIVAEPAADEGTEPTRSGDGPPLRPRAGFSAYGERGFPSEEVAADAVDALERWFETDAPVDAHLGDQLVVWLALAGGTVRIPRVTDHVRTNVDLVRAFGYEVSIEGGTDGSEATLVASTPPS